MSASPSGVYARLAQAYGEQHWWPADSALEMMIGAVLIQNTAWRNAERAITKLKDTVGMDPCALGGLAPERLAQLIRASGFYKVKAKRIAHLLHWYRQGGELEGLSALNTPTLRASLLSVNGIGEETADDILVYAFARPSFIVDAYTRRIFSRLGLIEHDERYAALQAYFHAALAPCARTFGEFHALIVAHAKHACRKRPRCERCCLKEQCVFVTRDRSSPVAKTS